MEVRLDDRPLEVTARTAHRRMRERGSTDRRRLEEILDAGFVCHLGLVVDGSPRVLPTVYGRQADALYVHGSVASVSLRGARAGAPCCVTVTHVDGLVLARSVFEHSLNYRSAVVYGVPDVLEGTEKLEGLRVLTEHVAPGQWAYARRPNARELAQTMVLRFPLDEASVKIRTGAPDDGADDDGALDLWAGEIPLRTVARRAVPDPALRPGIALPAHLVALAAALEQRVAPPVR